jgi:hypothetical protein
MSPNAGGWGRGVCESSANESNGAYHVTWIPNKLWRSTVTPCFYVSNFLLSLIQEEGESPPAPPPRGPVYPPGTPVHQDYGTTPLGPVAASPAQGGGGAHLYPPAYDTPLHEPNYEDGYQV